MAKRKKDPLRAIAYIRVSTSKQEVGPEAQALSIENWCKKHEIELACDPFIEIGVSGATDLHKRPMLLAAIAALGEYAAGTLVAYRRDRFARNMEVIGNLGLILRKTGCRLCTTEQRPIGFDEIDPMAKAMAGIQDVFAELERAIIRQRTINALSVKRRRLERVGTIPYGFQLSDDGKTLIPDANEQGLIELIHALRGEGLSLRKICDELCIRKIKPKHGGIWQTSSIRGILRRTLKG